MRVGLAWGVFGLACVLAVAGGPLTARTAQDVAIALSFTPLGAYLVARRAGGAVGPLCLMAALGAVAHAAERYGGHADVLRWLARWVWAPPLLSIGSVLLLLVPEGRLPSPRWRPVAAVAVAGITVFTVLLAFVPGPVGNPYAVKALRPLELGLPIALGVLALISISCMAGLVVRTVRATGQPRLQLLWICSGGVAFAVGSFSDSVLPGAVAVPLTAAGTFALPAGIALAMLRHDLYETGPLLRAFLTYGLLALVLAGVFALLAPIPGDANAVAAAGVALAAEPTRRFLGRTTGRILYGGRADPREAAARLAERLAATSVPDEIVAALAEAVTDVTRTPYLRVRLGPEDDPLKVIERGEPRPVALTVPLSFQGEALGSLDVAQGSPWMLRRLALQAGAALAAAHRQMALQHSRLLLVTAREEERRRISRDLHDGLGPVLAGIGFSVDAAGNALRDDPDRARSLLAHIRGQVGEAGTSVRRLVRGLRPPELAQLGLGPAIEYSSASLHASGVAVEVGVCDTSGLGAAVETAAYLVTREALTNAIRHSAARRCSVRLSRSATALTVTVADDGTGLPEPVTPGVGLSSMRERVAELGGTLTFTSGDPGTTVIASIPLGEER
ncbi:sensor histidine kinase [Microtetraspora niveoalba]|uniref:sensor histidine kinase n=1 Tax=Microtetraspora niveoalba TaxID=46175 RepID=UPI00082F9DCE|nr:sensor histidine kinase [Microtetraspora niveoalba]